MKLHPVNDRVLVRRTEKEAMTEGGLHIPDDRQIRSGWGEVLAVGPGRYLKNSTSRLPVNEAIKPGAVVRFRGTSGEELDFDGESDLVMLREDEVEAIQVEP